MGNDKKCQTCGEDVGIVHPGQIKKYCSKNCRLNRHNPQKLLGKKDESPKENIIHKQESTMFSDDETTTEGEEEVAATVDEDTAEVQPEGQPEGEETATEEGQAEEAAPEDSAPEEEAETAA